MAGASSSGAPRSRALVRACTERLSEALDKAAAFGFESVGSVEEALSARGEGFRRYQDFDYVAHQVEAASERMLELASDERALALVAAGLPGGVADVEAATRMGEAVREGGAPALHRAVWLDCPALLEALVAADARLAEEEVRGPVRYEAPRRGRRPQRQEGEDPS